jgi:hypothetical protein
MAAIQKYITIQHLAEFHQVDSGLLQEFAEFGLIRIQKTETTPCIVHEELEKCERIIRLHRELGVNKEGIDIILRMRETQTELQKEMKRLKYLLQKHGVQLEDPFTDDFSDED